MTLVLVHEAVNVYKNENVYMDIGLLTRGIMKTNGFHDTAG
jgi:hypothetical protein